VLFLRGAGACLCPRSRQALPRARRAVLLAVLGLLALMQVVGQLGGAPPPPASVLAVSWIVQTGVLVVLGLWADPAPVSAPAVAAPAGCPPAARPGRQERPRPEAGAPGTGTPRPPLRRRAVEPRRRPRRGGGRSSPSSPPGRRRGGP